MVLLPAELAGATGAVAAAGRPLHPPAAGEELAHLRNPLGLQTKTYFTGEMKHFKDI